MDAEILPHLVNLLSTAEFKIKKEACWAICNATSLFDSYPDVIRCVFLFNVRFIVKSHAIQPLCDILTCTDAKIVSVALDGIENILKAGSEEALASENNINPYALLIEEANGIDTICELQSHEQPSIYEKSKGIIDRYFGEDAYIEESKEEGQGFFGFDKNQPTAPQGGFSF